MGCSPELTCPASLQLSHLQAPSVLLSHLSLYFCTSHIHGTSEAHPRQPHGHALNYTKRGSLCVPGIIVLPGSAEPLPPVQSPAPRDAGLQLHPHTPALLPQPSQSLFWVQGHAGHCAPVLSLRFLLVGSGYFLKQKMYATLRYVFLRGLILKGQSAIDFPSEGGECHTSQGWSTPLPATVPPLSSCSRLCSWSFAHGGSAWQALPACCSAKLRSPIPHRAS